MSLGEIIEALEVEDPARILPLGFDAPHSYRGYYEQLGFEPAENISIGDMLAATRAALGATFQGYKGGDYKMSGYTECWLASYGECSEDMIGPTLLRLLLGHGPEGGAATRKPSDIWQAVAVEKSGYTVNPDSLAWQDGSFSICIVRRSALPDGAGLPPSSYSDADVAHMEDEFEDESDFRTRWAEAQAMASGLNAAEVSR